MNIEKIISVTITDLPGEVIIESAGGRVAIRQGPDLIVLAADEVADLIKALQEVTGEAPAVVAEPSKIVDNDGDVWNRRADGRYQCRSMIQTRAEIEDSYGIDTES